MPSRVKNPRLYAPGEERALAMAIRRGGRTGAHAGDGQTKLLMLLGAVRSALERWHNPAHARDGICLALGGWYAGWVEREIAERSTLARRYSEGPSAGRLYVYWGGVNYSTDDAADGAHAEACRQNREAILLQTERTIVHLLRMQGLRHAELEL